jgi:hypothetical protein
MSDGAVDRLGFLRRVDLLVLLGAVLALFIALGSEPWWTLSGTTTSNLLSVQVSPFYLHINAIGLPPTMVLANNLGSFTRVLLIFGSLALLAASFSPTAWWRNLAVYIGLSSLAELYFSFIMIYYWAETAIVQAYGVVPPYYGTTTLPARILGLDLRYYASPLVTATFNFPYYLGFLGLSLVMGRSVIKIIQDRAFQVLGALLPGGHIHDIYLTPPYQHIWFSSNDKEFNPLGKDPKMLNDDELLVSFKKLYDTVEPGGSLSIILPDWATTLGDRFQKLMPVTGFEVESSGIVYRVPGRPENELRFRRPVEEQTTLLDSKPLLEDAAPPSNPLSSTLPGEELVDSTKPPVIEIVQSPSWSNVRMTRPERTMLKSAVAIIIARGEPVPYRELLNQVYMELVEKKVDFDSARQIETSLLKHNGREILLLEERDEAGARVSQKWWVGDQRLPLDREHKIPIVGKITEHRPRLPKPRGLLTKFQRRKYRPQSTGDDESYSEQPGS